MEKPKIIVILGPTASGKSDLAVDLALEFNGEVVSADSRQVYKGMDVGTGKITDEEMKGIPHHLLDVVEPTDKYTVAHFKEQAEVAIDDVVVRGCSPILCGGTGFYIQSIVDNVTPPEVEPDESLRAKLAEKPTEELLEILRNLDPERAETVEQQNPRRLIRSIEIATHLGKVPNLAVQSPSKYNSLQIGIATDNETLRERINSRVDRRLHDGMIEEVQRLHSEGVSWERLDNFGLEYRYLSRHLRKEMTRDEALEKLKTEIWRYAKRQRTWFKRDKRVQWHTLSEKEIIFDIVRTFLAT